LSDLRAFVGWYLVLAALGVAAWPLARRLGGALGDRGWSCARALGLLAGALLWRLGNALGLLDRSPASAWVVFALVAGCSLALGWRSLWGNPRGTSSGRGLKGMLPPGLLSAEALLLAAFLLAAFLRASDPAARPTERPMDLMLIQAVAESPGFPIEDPWLAGDKLAYYDQGHWQIVWLARLSGVPLAQAYNLGVASTWALLALGAFGLARNLAGADPALVVRPRLRRAAGPLAAVAVALAGNGAGIVAAVQRLAGQAAARSPWWWSAGRAIVDQDAAGKPFPLITEFPFFSLLVGDLHAHLLAAPMGLLLATLVLGELAAVGKGESLGLVGLLVGATVAVSPLLANPWEVPGAALLWLGAGGILTWRARAQGRAVVLRQLGARVATYLAAGLLLASLASLVPGSLQGVALNTRQWTSPLEWLKVLGTLAPGLLLLGLLWRSGRGAPRSLAERAALGFAGVGLVLVVVPELVLVIDAFSSRMNTVFKLGFQAWPLLAVASAFGIVRGFALGPRGPRWCARAGLVALGAGLLYPAVAVGERLAPGGPPLDLDAIAFLRRENPATAAALAWIAEHVPRGAHVTQGRGESYRPDTVWVSVATGRATLLGCSGHERVWRGPRFGEVYGERNRALEEIYRHAEGAALADLLGRWRIDYLYLGPAERAEYHLEPQRETALGAALDRVFAAPGVTIFARRGAPS